MKSYRTLALKELLSQKVTSILILIAVVLSTMMTTIVGQSIGVLSAMREQQAIAIGGKDVYKRQTLLRLGKAVARRTISTNCISMVYLKNRQVQNEL